MKNTTMSIYAEALADNRNYKNARIDGKTVGVKEARTWGSAVKALRYPAYAIRQYRHANLGNAEEVAPCDMSKFYDALRVVLDLVGVVNGAKLSATNVAEEIIANASRIRTIDVTNEMSEARTRLGLVNKAVEGKMDGVVLVALDEDRAKFIKKLQEALESEEALATIQEDCKAEVKRLEGEAGNCIRLMEIQGENAFIKAVELLLGDAINKQTMKTLEEVLAEEEAKRQARRAKTAAKKAAKKAQA